MEYQELIKNIKILLADDDEDYLLMTDSFLKQLGYNVETASDGKQAVEKLMSGLLYARTEWRRSNYRNKET